MTETPPTVTLANADPASVSKSFLWASTIDSIVVSQDSEAAPANEPSTGTNSFTHTALAPLFEATEAPGDGQSVYYVSKSQEGPPKSTAVAVTTIIFRPSIPVTTIVVSPTPAPVTAGREVNTTIWGTDFRTATSTGSSTVNVSIMAAASSNGGYGVWNSAADGVATSTDASGSGPTSDEADTAGETVTNFAETSTIHVSTETILPSSVNATFTGYGALPTQTTTEASRLLPRQTCTWVDAGGYGGWCNNWNGETTFSYSSFETTGKFDSPLNKSLLTSPVYPEDTPKHTRASPVASSTTISTTAVVPATVTVTANVPPPAASDPNAPAQPLASDTAQPQQINATQPPQTNTTQPEQCGETGPFVIDVSIFVWQFTWLQLIVDSSTISLSRALLILLSSTPLDISGGVTTGPMLPLQLQCTLLKTGLILPSATLRTTTLWPDLPTLA